MGLNISRIPRVEHGSGVPLVPMWEMLQRVQPGNRPALTGRGGGYLVQSDKAPYLSRTQTCLPPLTGRVDLPAGEYKPPMRDLVTQPPLRPSRVRGKAEGRLQKCDDALPSAFRSSVS